MGAAGGAIIGALGGVAGTVGQMVSGRSAEREAKKEAKRRAAEQQALIGQLQSREAAAQGSRAAAAARARRLGAELPGLRDTILTGPMGLAAPGETGERKTLLGT